MKSINCFEHTANDTILYQRYNVWQYRWGRDSRPRRFHNTYSTPSAPSGSAVPPSRGLSCPAPAASASTNTTILRVPSLLFSHSSFWIKLLNMYLMYNNEFLVYKWNWKFWTKFYELLTNILKFWLLLHFLSPQFLGSRPSIPGCVNWLPTYRLIWNFTWNKNNTRNNVWK